MVRGRRRRWPETAIGARWRAGAIVLALAAVDATAWGDIGAPIIEPKPPSSAARPLAPAGDALTVLGETLSFRCGGGGCDVEARYRIQALAPVTTELAFVLPQAAPLMVRVGNALVPVAVGTLAAEPVNEDELRPETAVLESQHLAAVQARFSATFTAGENVVSVTYHQPLGRREYGHGYFRRARFVEFFRYELSPLWEWKHAAGFRIDGEVVIQRPPPSWWQRLFSTPRSVGCRGAEPLGNVSLQQRGAELRLAFRIPDPIPRRLWCEIGDEDLVPAP
jgi:hypothetical protein